MQQVSELFQSISSGDHWKEVKAVISGVEFRESSIVSLSTAGALYAENRPMIGSCVSAEVDLAYFPGDSIPPRMAKIELFVRVANSSAASEWIPKGVFFTDTRVVDGESGLYTVHGYDAMLKAEQRFWTEGDPGEWPRPANAVVAEIAARIGVTLDPRRSYPDTLLVPFPNEYTCRELLSQIGVALAGNWIITDAGQLLLIGLADIPAATGLLVDETGAVIRFGEVGIIVE